MSIDAVIQQLNSKDIFSDQGNKYETAESHKC